MRALLPLTLLLTALPALAGDGLVIGQAAPDFALKDTAGHNQRLSEWRGDTVLLSFWANWCGRCSDQLEQLQEIQAAYAARGVRVVTVNIDREVEPGRSAANRLKLLVLHDDEQLVGRQYQLTELPLTVVVDAHGTVRHLHQKYRGGDAALYEEELAALLNE